MCSKFFVLEEKEKGSMEDTVGPSFIHYAETRCNITSKVGKFKACTIKYESSRCIYCGSMVNITQNASAKRRSRKIIFIC
ncbi:hypothetical protein GQ607_015904 [Colletotrichum asianum]|uniref:Uncharacterized protein n=1 Tax=Colletotrichum asianum TaxID=702518 RepID=A0A8H3VYV2_9PEZI|nr:hypothetical protein GQ607_015904 [Colletotrichum asianum]